MPGISAATWCACCARAAIERGGASTGLNCGCGHGHSVREVTATVRGVSRVDVPVEEGPRRPGDPSTLVASSRKIGEVLGWRSRHDELEYIERTALRWEENLLAQDGPRRLGSGRPARQRSMPDAP